MCKVPIIEPEKKLDFILYNYLGQRKERTFTLSEIAGELKSLYNVQYPEKDIKAVIRSFIENGFVYQNVGRYVYTGGMVV